MIKHVAEKKVIGWSACWLCAMQYFELYLIRHTIAVRLWLSVFLIILLLENNVSGLQINDASI